MSVRLMHGNCLAILPTLDAESVDAVITDPPYGIGMFGREWDTFRPEKVRRREAQLERKGEYQPSAAWPSKNGARRIRGGGVAVSYDESATGNRAFQQWCASWARECLRVLNPGGHLVAFGGPRTEHRLVCGLEDAGFQIRDKLIWLFGCLSDDTEILIDGEWQPYHKATIGRHALCYNVDTDSYAWEPILETFCYDISNTAYRIESDSTDQIVSRNHRCLVERGGAYVFELAEEAARKCEARVPVLEDLPSLLAALPLPRPRPSDQESDMLAGVRTGVAESTALTSTGGAAIRHGGVGLSGVRHDVLASEGVGEADQSAPLLAAVQRDGARPGVGDTRAQGPLCLDQQQSRVVREEDERGTQPGVEGRRHAPTPAGQLWQRPIRALSPRVHHNGAERRVRDGASAGSSEGHRPATTPAGGGASRGPQSTAQCGIEPDALRDERRPQAVRASRFTRADLARITPFHYQGIVWCVRVPSGAFVARRNGKVFVTGNSGYPKSHNLCRCREPVPDGSDPYGWTVCRACNGRIGLGTALKPGWEPIVLARKPFRGTVLANVELHGTGALNIDGCRIAHACEADRQESEAKNQHTLYQNPGSNADSWSGSFPPRTNYDGSLGRWPANVVLDEAAAWLLDASVAPSTSRQGTPRQSAQPGNGFSLTHTGAEYDDAGGPSRFYYCPKPSSAERNAGLAGLPTRVPHDPARDGRAWDIPGSKATARANHHPTVKPVELMRWLIRLTVPPHGVVADPFAGSGTTGVGCVYEERACILIEQESAYLPIIEARIRHAQGPLFADLAVPS